MKFAFDLISDLHVETWPDFDWSGQATSPYCVVAGDVSRDPDQVVQTLAHLGSCYAGVFYIDGNDEHRDSLQDLSAGYKHLTEAIEKIPNVVYLQGNVVVINGVALLGTNGWWSYDFDFESDPEHSLDWYADYANITKSAATDIIGQAYRDAAYLSNSVARLQTHNDVKRIVIVTHTLPGAWLASHDLELTGTHKFNCLGNQHMQMALDQDSENKVSTWCFGHYHRSVDRQLNEVRYVSNCRGRGNTPWSQPVYYPKRIEIDV